MNNINTVLYNNKGSTEAYALAKLLHKYKFVACLYMLCDILQIVANLQGSLQAKQLNLAMVPVLVHVDSTITRLKELKEDPRTSTWFKDIKVFSMTLWDKTLGFQKVIKNSSTGQCTILTSRVWLTTFPKG